MRLYLISPPIMVISAEADTSLFVMNVINSTNIKPHTGVFFFFFTSFVHRSQIHYIFLSSFD